MKNNPWPAILVVVIILVVAGFVYFLFTPKVTAPTGITATTTSSTVVANNVTYSCDAGKTIAAGYTDTAVALTLSDGRSFNLSQTVSGSGIRYEQGAGTAEDIVFWSKGDNAFLTEGSSTTYANCVAGTTGSNGGAQSFTDQGKTFTFNYPSNVTVSGGGVGYTQNWMVNATLQGILFVKAVLPASFEPKTNFADATFTVGTSADSAAVTNCLVAPQSGGGVATRSLVVINGVSYVRYVTNDAGAGNLYETTSYRVIRHNQCYAIEYTIHSGNIDNYSPDQGITAFDESKVKAVMEGMVQSFKFLS